MFEVFHLSDRNIRKDNSLGKNWPPSIPRDPAYLLLAIVLDRLRQGALYARMLAQTNRPLSYANNNLTVLVRNRTQNLLC